jgi:hypothetical protein
MNNKNSKIYVNKINKNIDNNKKVYYSVYDSYNDYRKESINYYDIQNRINILFKCSDFVYKKKFLIKTLEFEKEFVIISKSYDYLLSIDGERIFIKDIIDIKNI